MMLQRISEKAPASFRAVALLAAGLALYACAGAREEATSAAKTTDNPAPPAVSAPQAKLVSFAAADGLEVSAALYMEHPESAPFIVLYHMAGSARGEYDKIVGRLAGLGFNSMAVDQRSGGNPTSARARALKLPSSYLDALPDMLAALAYAKAGPAKGKVLLMGSSYSAALALKMAGDSPTCCDAVLSFSPAEYFGQRDLITSSSKNITVPAFVTSAKAEGADWAGIFAAIPAASKASFLPQASGVHGAPALWPENPGSEEYWAALTAFLKSAGFLD